MLRLRKYEYESQNDFTMKEDSGGIKSIIESIPTSACLLINLLSFPSILDKMLNFQLENINYKRFFKFYIILLYQFNIFLEELQPLF